MKQQTSVILLTTVILATFLIESCAGIKCYVCDSRTDKKCSEANDVKYSVKSQECSVDNIKQFTKDYLKDHTIGAVRLLSLDNITKNNTICQKFVTNELGEKRILRFCQGKLDNNDACTIANSRIEAQPTAHKIVLESCDLCESDECNKGSNTQCSSILLAVIVAISISFKIFT